MLNVLSKTRPACRPITLIRPLRSAATGGRFIPSKLPGSHPAPISLYRKPASGMLAAQDRKTFNFGLSVPNNIESKVSMLARFPNVSQNVLMSRRRPFAQPGVNLTNSRYFSTRNDGSEKPPRAPVDNSVNQPSKDVATGSNKDPANRSAKDPTKDGKVYPHRSKTLEYHLNQMKTFWGRLAVRTKWALIKNYRPFNTDEIGAMFSWIVWGHILWILLGTTTFISLLIWAMSQFRAEDLVARWVGRLVTKETGLHVVFEQAIVPDWKVGSIALNKVFIQRRPGTVHNVATGPQTCAFGEKTDPARTQESPVMTDDSHTTTQDIGNYTQFDLTVDTISVTLSLKRWLSGRGILETIEAKGVRGVIDRRYLKFDPHYEPTKHRKKYKRGDFDWETVKIEDLMVTVLQPNHQPELPPVPPFQISLFSGEFPRLRKQWLFYDLLNANYVSGSFDNAMFSMHTRQLPTDVNVHNQSFNYNQAAFSPNRNDKTLSISSSPKPPPFRKVQRLRIDDVDIRHLNRGVTGMFGWIESGTCDFLADIMLPSDNLEFTTGEKFKDLVERWEAQIKSIWSNKQPTDIVTEVERDVHRREHSKTVAIDLRVQFNNPRASAPLYSPDLNYINNAIIHPMVAYINSRDTYIPVHCHVAKRLYDFDGSWTVYDSGLMADLSGEIYRAFARNARDDEARSRRIKKVGFWSLQFMAQLVLLTLGIVA